MISDETLCWGTEKSCIREIFEYGLRRKAELGEDKVFDFSLGNPSVPAPPEVRAAILRALDDPTVHGYTVAPGRVSLREKIAGELNGRCGSRLGPEDIYVTCGAAAALASAMKGLTRPGEEVVALAPYFPEYAVFARGAGARFLSCPLRSADLQLDPAALEGVLTEKTAVVLVNSPNNPSGAVLNAESLGTLAEVMERAERRFGHPIYLVSDEPYRELVYEGATAESPLRYYDDTIVCYSWSKSLSLPGERVGYFAVSDRAAGRREIYASMAGAARSYGYVNPPSLMQRVAEDCVGLAPDLEAYRKNRAALCEALDAAGFSYIRPDGAFYLFIRSPEPDAKAFSLRAREHGLLLVPSDDFGVGGFVRAAYCVAPEVIERAGPAFAALAGEYGIT